MSRDNESQGHPIVPVIMAGGSSNRLWPVARLGYPRHFQSPAGGRSPFLDSLVRLRSWVPGAGKPIIVTAPEHYHVVKQQLDSIDLEPLAIVLEPEARKSGPAVTTAALIARSLHPDALLLVTPCDQVLRDERRLAEAIEAASAAAAEGELVVFGLADESGDAAASYLATADNRRRDGLLTLAGFHEGDKPAAGAGGPLLMNSGIYCFTAETLLAEAQREAPAIVRACRQAFADADQDAHVYRPAAQSFAAAPAVSLGEAVLARSKRTVVVPLDLQWNDLGSWQTLWNLGQRDGNDNLCVGDAHVLDSQGVYVRSEGPLTAVYGVDDLVVVATPEAVLVARRDDSKGVAKIHHHLAARGRDEVLGQRKQQEDWGWVETIEERQNYALRRIVVHPGCSLPVERHHHHSETITVVAGLAHLWLDGQRMTLRENESATIPLRALHELQNPGRHSLEIIEVQAGSVIGDEDRIVLDRSCKEMLPRAASPAANFADSEARGLLAVGRARRLVRQAATSVALDSACHI